MLLPRMLPDFITARFMSLAQPMVRQGVAYIGSIDLKTGKAAWEFKTGGEIYHCPAVFDGTVYFGADMYAYALETATGKLKWKSIALRRGVRALLARCVGEGENGVLPDVQPDRPGAGVRGGQRGPVRLREGAERRWKESSMRSRGIAACSS